MGGGNDAGGSRFAGLETAGESGGGAGTGAVVRDADFYLNAALERELDGGHDKALTLYSAALGEDPLCIGAWTRQLWMLLYLDESIEAAIWADKALQFFPNDPDVLALKSLAQWRNGLAEEARELNDAALAAARDSADVWLARGEMHIARNMKSALACFKHAGSAPGMPGLALLRAGDILFRLERYAEASGYCREATRAFPGSSWAWYGYGRAEKALGRLASARAAFGRAYALSPADARYKTAHKEKPGFFARLLERLLR